MPTPFELIEAEALKLSAADRARLAEHLISSLDEDSGIEAAWAAEVGRRVTEAEKGSATAISFAEAIAQARAALR